MNKSYRSIWNEKVGTFVAVAETAMACGKKNSGAVVDCIGGGREEQRASSVPFKAVAGFGAAVALLLGATPSWAQYVQTCTSSGSGG
ncbi:ESPR domain-containing protein [Caballeronia cordobensis]|uniref:ESPR domain-containing protein n=1 Tax=Caballeronia cordobensis TaxID=1353886 RepID=UPI00094FFE16